MKKNYLLAFCLFSALSFAQQQIVSFETLDGFYTGDINGQGTWISTPTGDFPANVLNQTVCTDDASDGFNSLRIVKENTYGTQSVPVIGAFDNLPIMLSYNNFTVSFDMKMSQLNGSIFSFQGVNSADEKLAVRLDFDPAGIIKILKNSSGGPVMESASVTWQPNLWYRLTVMGTTADVKYYLNGTLIYSGTAAEMIDMNQLRFVHDNAAGTAYVDHIKVHNAAVLSVSEEAVNKSSVKIYPNPAMDFITISSEGKIKSTEMYDSAGKKIQILTENDKINVSDLPAGSYLIHTKTEKGNFSEKFIKK